MIRPQPAGNRSLPGRRGRPTGEGRERRPVQLLPHMLTRYQPVERPGADLPADQAQGRKADRRRHASDLAVTAFGQREPQPTGWNLGAIAHRGLARPEPIRRRNALDLGGQGAAILEFDTLAQLLHCTVGDHAIHLDDVGLG